jgi:hypothetical protein
MVDLSLNKELRMSASYQAEPEKIDIFVKDASERGIWFWDQSFAVESFVFDSQTGQWKKFELGFELGDVHPKLISSDSPIGETHYAVPANRAGRKEPMTLRLLIKGCLGGSCRAPDDMVGAYADVFVYPQEDKQLSPATDPDDRRLYESLLTDEDLPEGWSRGQPEKLPWENGVLVIVPFDQQDRPGSLDMNQQLTLYLTAEMAQIAFKVGWPGNPEIPYQAKIPQIDYVSRADQFKIGCLHGESELEPPHSCIVIARYDRLVSLLMATMYEDEPRFTWSDLEQVLQAIDRRALEAAGR